MADPDRSRLLSAAEVTTALDSLEHWSRDGDRLRASFVFADFSAAFAFMSHVALIAERLFHHPEWSNEWGRVDIAVTNHQAGGLTELDLEFARRVSAAAPV